MRIIHASVVALSVLVTAALASIIGYTIPSLTVGLMALGCILLRTVLYYANTAMIIAHTSSKDLGGKNEA